MASRVAAGAAAVALVAAGCGGAKQFDPDASRLITKSLEAARAQKSVYFHADLSVGAKLDGGKLSSGLLREQLTALADNPFHLTLDGIRSDKAFTADGTLEVSGAARHFGVLQFQDRLLLRVGDKWYRVHGTIGQIFRIESFAGLIPQEACMKGGQSEGCDEVDFGPALERGHIGGAVKGAVERKSDETVISGTVDAAGFAAFKSGTTPRRRDTRGIYDGVLESLRPYEDSAEVEFVIGKDGLPRRFVFSYHLDRDALRRHLRGSTAPVSEREARLQIDLSDWGTGFDLVIPDPDADLPPDTYRSLFEAVYLFL